MVRFLPVAVCLSLLLSAAPASAAFTDVPSSHPYAAAIASVETKGIISGYGDGTFRPDQTINRAEFTKILVAATLEQSDIDGCSEPGMSFIDVPTNQWYSHYVCAAKKRGVVAGYPDGSFGPDRTINFAEAAKIIALSFGEPHGLSIVRNEGEAWWLAFVNALGSIGALPPTFTSAEQLVRRGEMAFMIATILDGSPSPSDGSSSSPMSSSSSSIVSTGNTYRAYEEGVVGQGTDAVLFFHAPWCPYCKAHDTELMQWVSDASLKINVYKVDFDTALDVRERYGVINQDTFIRFDAKGKEVGRLNLGANQEALKEFLQ